MHLYGHSQGTMVISEGLRNIALDSSLTKPYVESMTFSQSAISARTYQSDYPAYEGWDALWDNVKSGIIGWAFAAVAEHIFAEPDTWPDLHGKYPYYLEMTDYPKQYAPYFEPVKTAVKEGKMLNFYNPVDLATGEYSEGQEFSGSWLIDQLIKPYRILKINYGVSGLGDEAKKYFTRNGTRDDFYCTSNWTNPPQCYPFTEKYDFKDTETRFSLIALGGASYSRTLGGHDANISLGPESGFSGDPKGNEINLNDPNKPYKYMHYVMWHGAQFRGSLCKQIDYWKTYMDNIELHPK